MISKVPKPLTRDASFFFSTVYIQVEDTIFSIPKETLACPGSWFEALTRSPLRGPSHKDEDIEIDIDGATPPVHNTVTDLGSSEKSPLVVNGVSKCVFKNFLRFVYPSINQTFERNPLPTDALFEVMKLATNWNVEHARKRVSNVLTPHVHSSLPEKQVIWGQEYRIRDWFYRGLLVMIKAHSSYQIPYGTLAANGIRLHTIIKLLSLREYYLARVCENHTDQSTGMPVLELTCGSCGKVGQPKSDLTLGQIMWSSMGHYFCGEMSHKLSIQHKYCNTCCVPPPGIVT